MLRIRHATEEDTKALLAIHAEQNLGYELPEFNRADWIVRAVAEEEGQLQAGLLARRTPELYLLIGKAAGRGEERIGKVLALEEAVIPLLKRLGYHDMHANLPLEIEKQFGRHLLARGWVKLAWPEYWREL